mmetsp:Transcript_122410/g.238165  ORF Transcript_122410/g.238165 Transcript_122410/m.238165 type:complete len:80 (+) Transcript_122410:134-373(+)
MTGHTRDSCSNLQLLAKHFCTPAHSKPSLRLLLFQEGILKLRDKSCHLHLQTEGHQVATVSKKAASIGRLDQWHVLKQE